MMAGFTALRPQLETAAAEEVWDAELKKDFALADSGPELREDFASKPFDRELSRDFSPDSRGERLVRGEGGGRELSLEEKASLRGIHMTPANIEKCTVDAHGVFRLRCINQEYAGKCHPDTGVLYTEKTVVIDGVKLRGVFPEFSSLYETRLPDTLRGGTESAQFAYLNGQLREAIKADPGLREQFSQRQLAMIESGLKPAGTTWHHKEDLCQMQLVRFEDHNHTKHTGGNSIWSDGT